MLGEQSITGRPLFMFSGPRSDGMIQTIINLWATGRWSRNRWGAKTTSAYSVEGNLQWQIKRLIFTSSAWTLGVHLEQTYKGRAYKTNRWLKPLGRSNQTTYWMLLIITFTWNRMLILLLIRHTGHKGLLIFFFKSKPLYDWDMLWTNGTALSNVM